ncbi:LysR substrate-binding domain-containing protein [Methylobacterium sp. 10]|uniref:LysR substrate-binding domain-containing protein n=1 Tax=Methylobacterium sp. 10 TaxID=1101191 RepID=UPI0004AD5746|nr:LysR substrate-binding domain-containing protein [Methylobacterium sp. 10]
MHNLPALPDLKLFCVAVETGSLARAAAEMGLAPSTVSKRLTVLEADLGVRLMHRTTRRLALTEDGDAVYAWAQRLLGSVDDMVQDLSNAGSRPHGRLRVSTSTGFARNHIAVVVSAFAARYADVEVRLDTLDRPVDPSAEGIDVDIRVGGLREAHLFAHLLAPNRRILCASPDYLAASGQPATLAELESHRCLVIRERDQPMGAWRLTGPSGIETVKVRSSLSTTLGEIAHRWALDGHGIILRSSWDVAENIRTGRLRHILPEYGQEADVWAVHPTRLSRSPKVTAFLDMCAAHLKSLSLAMPTPAPPGVGRAGAGAE